MSKMFSSSEKTWPVRAMFILLALFLFSSGETSAAESDGPARGVRKDARSTKKTGKNDEKKEKKTGKTEKKEEKAQESLFLPEPDESQAYIPEIYRCSECGYEQDEPGTCPDHEIAPLSLVLSKGKNPLAPVEVDGNEDLLVDIPLTGIQFKKATTASGEASLSSGPQPPVMPVAGLSPASAGIIVQPPPSLSQPSPSEK